MARKEITQRRRALDVIFEAEQKDILVPGLLRELLAERQQVSTSQVPIQKLGVELVTLVADHLYEIDELVDTYSKWGLRRLSSLDRTVLRLGIGEIVFAGADLRETVYDYTAIVRELGTEKSIGFITAILNRAKDEADGRGATRVTELPQRTGENAEVLADESGSQGDLDTAEASAETLMAEADIDRTVVGEAVEAEADVIESDINKAEVVDALETSGPLHSAPTADDAGDSPESDRFE
ncbi:transcription antitermination factor NusB [Flaviflexus huanghaiensis]|uniref:transcription antitermination factor NusB n=1 Tax=Flaviflexus huanghaiensis TaxID=1111473 RepID=UPI0015F855EA